MGCFSSTRRCLSCDFARYSAHNLIIAPNFSSLLQVFPQPWYYGTKLFPHPFSGLSYDEEDIGMFNFTSYSMFEGVMSAGFGTFLNHWRMNTLNLPPLPRNINFVNPIVKCNVPFSAMWSPSFLPKPGDWPEQCRVVGTFTEAKVGDKNAKKVTLPPKEQEKLASLILWLEAGGDERKPVFIGFGSMVIKDTTNLADAIKNAAKETNTRIVVQSSWSKIDVSHDGDGEQLWYVLSLYTVF